jgi:hypothetical protein
VRGVDKIDGWLRSLQKDTSAPYLDNFNWHGKLLVLREFFKYWNDCVVEGKIFDCVFGMQVATLTVIERAMKRILDKLEKTEPGAPGTT